MKILLDECVPLSLRHHLVGHEVFTALFMGWCGVKNGALLRLAAEHHFDLLLTIDKGYATEQNLTALPTAILLVEVGSDDIDVLVKLAPQMLQILATLSPRSLHILRG